MQNGQTIQVIDAQGVRSALTYGVCIPLMREAMMALSSGRTAQLLRSFIHLADEKVFGIMPGALLSDGYFGAKLVSVFADSKSPGRSRHRGIVALFEVGSGLPVCVADAEEITLVRTAAASAVATDALSRPGPSLLAVLGSGHQAIAHIHAISAVRPLTQINLWGRSRERAERMAQQVRERMCIDVNVVDDVQSAVRNADIICTTTAAPEPILFGKWTRHGAHINLVGSSNRSAAEIDTELVRRASYFVDSRESALIQAGEFLRAKATGHVDDGHIRAEIGEVLLGKHAGRADEAEVTIYKSLGHPVQDLVATAYIYDHARGMPDRCETK